MSCVLTSSLSAYKVLPCLSVKIRSSFQSYLMDMSSTWFITYCGMGSRVNLFLLILCPVLRLTNLHITWKFAVGPWHMAPWDLSAKVLVGGASSCVSGFVPNYTLQCLEQSRVQSSMMVLGEYICDIAPTWGKEFIHITKTGLSQLQSDLEICLMLEWSIWIPYIPWSIWYVALSLVHAHLYWLYWGLISLEIFF